MAVDSLCREQIISEEYRDFIIRGVRTGFLGRGNWFRAL